MGRFMGHLGLCGESENIIRRGSTGTGSRAIPLGTQGDSELGGKVGWTDIGDPGIRLARNGQHEDLY